MGKKGKQEAKQQNKEGLNSKEKEPKDTKGGSDEDTETKVTTDSFEHIDKENEKLQLRNQELENEIQQLKKTQEDLQKKKDESESLKTELNNTKKQLESAQSEIESQKKESEETKKSLKSQYETARELSEAEIREKHKSEIARLNEKLIQGDRSEVQLRETKELLKTALKEQESLENQVSNLERKLANVQKSGSGNDLTTFIGGMVAVWVPMVYLFSSIVN